MRRSRLLALLVALVAPALLVPSLAGAQSTQSTSFFGGTPLSVRSVPVRFTGALTVNFHGDSASGCASRGLCGYAGTVTWQPPATGGLEILTSRAHGRVSYALALLPANLTGFPGSPGGVATAKVQLSSSPPLTPTVVSSCLDAADTGGSLSLPVRQGRVAFTLAEASPSLLGTRCAGPLDGDVLPDVPAPNIPLGAVLRGRRVVSLLASHDFASDGFAGTVQSTLTIALGRPGRVQRTQSGNPAPTFRQIQVVYRAALSGSVVEHISGSANPDICMPLGSCGLGGTVTLAPRATGVEAALSAIGSARTPYGDLLTAVGLSTHGRAKGVLVTGAVTWEGGLASANLEQASTSCHDSAPRGRGEIILSAARGRLEAQYAPGFGSLTARTRCPGPAATNATSLATGAVPLARLAHRTIRLALTTGQSISDYGYDVHTVPHLTLTLTRVRVRVRTEPEVSSVISGSLGTVSRSLSGSFRGF